MADSPVEQALRAIHDNEPCTVAEVARIVGGVESTVAWHIADLMLDRGWVEPVGADQWRTTEVGRAYIGEDETAKLRRKNAQLSERCSRLSREVATLRRRLARTEAA